MISVTVRADVTVGARTNKTIEDRSNRGEQQVADAFDPLALANTHINLATAVVQPDGPGGLDEVVAEVLASDQLVDGGLEIGVGQHGIRPDLSAVDQHATDPAAVDANALHLTLLPHVDAVGQHLALHQADEFVRPPLENVDTLAHEIREHYTIGDGRIVQRRAVGVGDGFHQQPPDAGASGEEPLEQIAGSGCAIVIEIHLPNGLEEALDRVGLDTEVIHQQAGEVRPVEGRLELELGIIEADAFELDDAVGYLFGPILAAALDHPDREAV